jgi:hypothetical protein
MSRLLILFLIALLPLRGWTAQRMVLELDADVAVVSVAQATGMSEDCALHMHIAGKVQGEEAPRGPTPAGCHLCDICMPLGATQETAVLVFAPDSQALAMRHAATFESADPARYAKPPIS